MKPRVQISIAMATMLILPAVILQPASAAPTAKTKAASQASRWPRWYYYDQYGLRAWNAGDKEKAKRYFTQALNGCQADIGSKKNLNPVTKRMVDDVIKHQLFLAAYFVTPDKKILRKCTPKEAMALTHVYQIDQTKEKIKFIDRLIRFEERIYGKRDSRVQDLVRMQAQYRIRVIQMKAQVEQLRGWPRNSYDNGGDHAVTSYYHINPDGTTTEIEKPTEAAVRGHDPDFDRNEWYKKNYKDATKSGSYYRGLRPTEGRHMPDWYAKTGNKPMDKRKDDNDKTMYVGKKKLERNTPYVGPDFTPNKPKTPASRSKYWGDNPRASNDPTSSKQRRGWGAPQPYKTRGLTSNKKRDSDKNIHWGTNRKPKKDPVNTTAEDRMQMNPKARELMKRFSGHVNTD